MIFFRDVLATALNKPFVKLLVILVFLVYLAIGIYGCSVIKEGLDRRKLSRDDSYSVQFYDFEDKYFREYPYRIQVVVNETYNYADPKTQTMIENMLQRFEKSPYVADSSMTESWLRSYLKFMDNEDSFLFLQVVSFRKRTPLMILARLSTCPTQSTFTEACGTSSFTSRSPNSSVTTLCSTRMAPK